METIKNEVVVVLRSSQGSVKVLVGREDFWRDLSVVLFLLLALTVLLLCKEGNKHKISNVHSSIILCIDSKERKQYGCNKFLFDWNARNVFNFQLSSFEPSFLRILILTFSFLSFCLLIALLLVSLLLLSQGLLLFLVEVLLLLAVLLLLGGAVLLLGGGVGAVRALQLLGLIGGGIALERKEINSLKGKSYLSGRHN